ncbi:MAG TPA: hypothetical protein VLH08_23000, partial [Acidobacteriota bacterium]|nr:hypothetical protein [Acidobacteriota bacterium]
MNTRFLIFFGIITILLSLSAFYIGNRVISRFVWAANHRGAIWLTLAIFVVLQILGPYLYRARPDQLNRFFLLHWVSYTALGVFVCMLLYTVAADFSLGLWKKIARPENSIN